MLFRTLKSFIVAIFFLFSLQPLSAQILQLLIEDDMLYLREDHPKFQKKYDNNELRKVNDVYKNWQKLDENIYFCIDEGLKIQGKSIDFFIRLEIDPFDKIFTDVRNLCSSIAKYKLASRIPCTLLDQQKMCHEEYVFINNPTKSAPLDKLVSELLSGNANKIGVAIMK